MSMNRKRIVGTIWPGLLAAPLIALAQQSITYALVTPSCGHQTRAALHSVAAVAFAITLALTVHAALGWMHARRDTRPADQRGDMQAALQDSAPPDGQRHHVLLLIATLTAALASLASAAMWFPIWVLSPCSN